MDDRSVMLTHNEVREMRQQLLQVGMWSGDVNAGLDPMAMYTLSGEAVYPNGNNNSLVPYKRQRSDDDDDDEEEENGDEDEDDQALFAALGNDNGNGAASPQVEQMEPPGAQGQQQQQQNARGPSGFVNVPPPSVVEPLRRWGQPDGKDECPLCEWDKMTLGVKKGDVVADKWMRWKTFLERLAANNTLNNYDRAERGAKAYNETILPIRQQVLECARDQRKERVRDDYKPLNPLVLYEHIGPGHLWSSIVRSKRTRAMLDGEEGNNDMEPDEAEAAMVINERDDMVYIPPSGDPLVDLIDVCRNCVSHVYNKEAFYVDKDPNGQEVTKTDAKSLGKIHRLGSLLMNACKLQQQQEMQRRRELAANSSNGASDMANAVANKAAASITSTTALNRLTKAGDIASFSANATRNQRQSDLELFRDFNGARPH